MPCRTPGLGNLPEVLCLRAECGEGGGQSRPGPSTGDPRCGGVARHPGLGGGATREQCRGSGALVLHLPAGLQSRLNRSWILCTCHYGAEWWSFPASNILVKRHMRLHLLRLSQLCCWNKILYLGLNCRCLFLTALEVVSKARAWASRGGISLCVSAQGRGSPYMNPSSPYINPSMRAILRIFVRLWGIWRWTSQVCTLQCSSSLRSLLKTAIY